MSKGIVVDHRESRVRYAISAHNFNEKIHKLVRDLLPGETVLGYQPHPIKRLGEKEPEQTLPDTTPAEVPESAKALAESSDQTEQPSTTDDSAPATEGSAPAGTEGQ